MQNVTMSNLVKELEGYKLCSGVQTLELTSKIFHHVVPINHDTVIEQEEKVEEEEQQQFPHKGFWRAKGCLLIQEQEEACSVCRTYAGCALPLLTMVCHINIGATKRFQTISSVTSILQKITVFSNTS